MSGCGALLRACGGVLFEDAVPVRSWAAVGAYAAAAATVAVSVIVLSCHH
jgi:hypothetical protein